MRRKWIKCAEKGTNMVEYIRRRDLRTPPCWL